MGCREIDGNSVAPALNKLVLFTKHPERSNYPTCNPQEVTNPTHSLAVTPKAGVSADNVE